MQIAKAACYLCLSVAEMLLCTAGVCVASEMSHAGGNRNRNRRKTELCGLMSLSGWWVVGGMSASKRLVVLSAKLG